MYTTKYTNGKICESYTSIGDPYIDRNPNPFRQPKKGEKAPTPFQVTIKPTNEDNGNFGKLIYKGTLYEDSNKYIKTQPLDKRKKGFGTKDASKRDEFSNFIRTEQYRETMKKEKGFIKKNSERTKEMLTTLLATRAANDLATRPMTVASGTRDYSQKVAQFDIGRTQVTEFNPKSVKDTFYVFNGGKRFDSTNVPVSYDIGKSANDITYKPPSFGGKSEVKLFWDKSHLNVRQYS